ncbi:cobalamin biosynthesis protein CbiG [Eggerthellaceae bacterium zg-997]|nr:cobalamin biosynthesis protein CbiG [Eggerthellaceae bacterium zg-997]
MSRNVSEARAGRGPAAGRVSLVAFTDAGCRLALRLAAGLRAGDPAWDADVAAPARLAGRHEGVEAAASAAAWARERFGRADALLFVGAAGIAVRSVAPLLRDKLLDPAVVSVDERGAFAVPLVSGHVGGANRLARQVAALCGGRAAVSTATDVNGVFAIDEWAARTGLAIVEREVAREASARLLEGLPVGLTCSFPLAGSVPSGFSTLDGKDARAADDSRPAADLPAVGVAIGLSEGVTPFPRTLHLVPRVVTVGVGCRRGTPPARLRDAVLRALEAAECSRWALAAVASIDVKADEPAVIELARAWGLPLRLYAAERLASVPGSFAASAFVRQAVGVDGVCERASVAEGGTLLLAKQAGDGCTVALGAMPVTIDFQEGGVR